LQGAAFRRAAARLLLVFAIGVGLRTPAGGAEVLDDAPAAAEDSHAQRPLSFTRDVVPVFTKLGCNAGSCHGSFQGRGGFRLSLLGFDPQADYAAVVYEGRGRRVFPAAPGMSLLLRKPTLQVPHGGGLRLIPESAAYRILNTWLSQGMPAPEAGKLRVVRLEPNLSALNMQPGDTHDLCAQAVWSDGVVTEASTWAQFDTTDERVAVVDGNGTIRAVGPGRAAITMRFMGQVAVATITVPFPPLAARPGWQQAWSPQNFIDEMVVAEWEQLGLCPGPPAGDAEFMRRAYLDLIGTLPSPEEVLAFLAEAEPGKRARLVERLLARPEYVEYWSLKWGDLLRAHRRYLGEKGLASFQSWLRAALRENRPVDAMVRELLTAQGNLYANGANAFYFVDQTPEDLAESTAQVFLGVRLQCARCHHHPFEVWGQEDHRSLSLFFAHIRRKDTKEGGRFGGMQAISVDPTAVPEAIWREAAGQSTLLRRLSGTHATQIDAAPAWVVAESTAASPGQAAASPPADLQGGAAQHASQQAAAAADIRTRLAAWVTSGENPYFARNIVNRYWSYLFGRGLVEPVDDLRATNPPLHPALLDALAEDFVRHGYDLKHLLRTICNSQVYQLASDLEAERDAQGAFLTHRVPRPLGAEVLLDAVNQAAGYTERFENLPQGTRAISLPDSAVASEFLDTFGRPLRTTTCECERKQQPDLRRALLLANSAYIHQKVASPAGRVNVLCASQKSDREIVETLYLAALSRLPTQGELQTALVLCAEAPTREEGFEDLLWALINCAEFGFSH